MGWARASVAVIGLLVVAVGPLACRDVLGIEERSSDGLGGGAPELPGGACNLGLFSTIPDVQCRSCLTTGLTSCCAAIDACAANPACVGCLRPDAACPSPPPAAFEELVACVRGSCEDECYPTYDGQAPDVLDVAYDLGIPNNGCLQDVEVGCDPMVQSPTCSWQAGAACDISPRKPGPADGGGFACYLSNRRHIGESCGLVEGMCHFGLTCANYRCARFCCDDAGCGDGNTCDPSWIQFKLPGFPAESLGICVKGRPDE